jgi:hypothetical protein
LSLNEEDNVEQSEAELRSFVEQVKRKPNSIKTEAQWAVQRSENYISPFSNIYILD